ncbi:TPA: ECF transporter S component [Enterococcus faecalis]
MKKNFKYIFCASLLAIMIIMNLVPFLGFIPIGPINLTTLHIPVIVGSIILGPKLGAFLGFSFGTMSLWKATVSPSPLSFLFSPFIPVIGSNNGSWYALIIVYAPRILIGILSYYVYKYIKKMKFRNTTSLFVSGITGSLINTILVLNLAYLLFYDGYGKVIGKTGSLLYKAILTVMLTNGLPEAIIAGILTSLICQSIFHAQKNHKL